MIKRFKGEYSIDFAEFDLANYDNEFYEKQIKLRVAQNLLSKVFELYPIIQYDNLNAGRSEFTFDIVTLSQDELVVLNSLVYELCLNANRVGKDNEARIVKLFGEEFLNKIKKTITKGNE